MLRCRGYSRFEILSGLVVFGVVIAVAVPRFSPADLPGREMALKRSLKSYRSAISLFLHDTGLYPTRLADLCARQAPAYGLSSSGQKQKLKPNRYLGPYITMIADDPVARESVRYGVPATGMVQASASGIATDGTKYSTW